MNIPNWDIRCERDVAMRGWKLFFSNRDNELKQVGLFFGDNSRVRYLLPHTGGWKTLTEWEGYGQYPEIIITKKNQEGETEMSTAYKCDKCGELIEYWGEELILSETTIQKKKFVVSVTAQLAEHLDLCRPCYSAILAIAAKEGEESCR